MNRPQVEMSGYTYDLPQSRIATYPMPERDASKLLIYNKGVVSHRHFYDLPDLIDGKPLMIFNNTRVVPARLFFQKPTGAIIEIFCLEPHDPEEYSLAFSSSGRCVWKAIVGNKRKWNGDAIPLYMPDGHDTELSSMDLCARIVGTQENAFYVEFSWKGELPFSSVLEMCGKVPIPPYLNRESEEIDRSRYQTLYARYRGSVAAPTAGLHFTERVLGRLKEKGVDMDNVCLHVGAGTFLPVKSSQIAGHVMHSEPFSISYSLLDKLIEHIDSKDIIAVGTTSVRTLESLYFLGCQCVQETPEKWVPKPVGQWDPYNLDQEIPAQEALSALKAYMKLHQMEHLYSRTQIIIVPSYRYRIVNKLITNFHQPQSTLLLLIAALIGEDWKKVYRYALDHTFRFLSYGDSSFLIP